MRSKARKKIEMTRLETISFQLDLSLGWYSYAGTTAASDFNVNESDDDDNTCAKNGKLIFGLLVKFLPRRRGKNFKCKSETFCFRLFNLPSGNLSLMNY